MLVVFCFVFWVALVIVREDVSYVLVFLSTFLGG